MIFKKIFLTWGKSLDFFELKNLKMFFLATLNNVFRSLKILMKKTWWLVLAFLLIILTSYILLIYSKQFFLLQVFFLALFISSLLIFGSFFSFIIFLLVRPSSESKNLSYLNKYLPKFLGFVFIFLLFYLLARVFVLSAIASMALFLIACLAVFFFLDEPNTGTSVIKAIYLSFKAFLFFLPVFLFLNLIYFFNYFVFFQLLTFFLKINDLSIVMISCMILCMILYVFLLFFNLSLLVNYYTIIRHKNYNLLYD